MPVRGLINVTLRFEADLVRLALDHPHDLEVVAKKERDPVEKGRTFLWDFVKGQLDAVLIPCTGLEDRTSFDDTQIEFHWTPAHAREFEEKLDAARYALVENTKIEKELAEHE